MHHRLTQDRLPPRWPWLFRLFRRYARRYAARHLHAVRLSKSGRPPTRPEGPVVVVLNHPSWWDPLICFVLSELFPDRNHWAPIEAAGLRQYRFLGRVGMFGVESGSAHGAAAFLRTSRAILADSRAMLWITAQGRFADVRERPLRLRSGVGHIAARLDRGTILPLSLEYPFWDQRAPEALARFGEPIGIVAARVQTAREWTDVIAGALERTLDDLAAEARQRDAGRFEVLVSGRVGVGGVYDTCRRLRAWLRGETFQAEHRL
jgi:1-acyl-sn-glycerol-3-phosphate acyltransferase